MDDKSCRSYLSKDCKPKCKVTVVIKMKKQKVTKQDEQIKSE